MQTDLLKTMFVGDKGPPAPPGIRMRGIFAASTGFSAQFFPESVIPGCGPDVARAYRYTVVADGSQSFIRIDAPDHPLTVAFRTDGSLDPGSGAYQVDGRSIMISTRYHNQSLIWGQAVELKAGQNELKLDQSNATPVN
jgi:hypothetical protein